MAITTGKNSWGWDKADDLTGTGGVDTPSGGDGRDRLHGGAGGDSLAGGSGDDTAHDSDAAGQGMREVNIGGAGNGVFDDGFGKDVPNGDDGDDLFHLGACLRAEDQAADTVSGGAGYEVASYADADASVVIDLGNQANNAGTARGDVLTGIERVEGSGHDDRLTGDGANNTLDGAGSDDVLKGGAGNDTLIGGAGAGELTGGAGSDVLAPEPDDGWLSYDTCWPHDTATDLVRGQGQLAVVESEFGVDADGFVLIARADNVVTGKGAAVVFETDTGQPRFDADRGGSDTDGDGDGVVDENIDAVLIATLKGVTTLAANDFAFFES